VQNTFTRYLNGETALWTPHVHFIGARAQRQSGLSGIPSHRCTIQQTYHQCTIKTVYHVSASLGMQSTILLWQVCRT